MTAQEMADYKLLKHVTANKYTPVSVHQAMIIRAEYRERTKPIMYLSGKLRADVMNQMRTTLINEMAN